VEGVVLIFNHYAGEADLHGVLLGDLVWRARVEEQRTCWTTRDAIIRERELMKRGAAWMKLGIV
jgi:hypothetical protein